MQGTHVVKEWWLMSWLSTLYSTCRSHECVDCLMKLIRWAPCLQRWELLGTHVLPGDDRAQSCSQSTMFLLANFHWLVAITSSSPIVVLDPGQRLFMTFGLLLLCLEVLICLGDACICACKLGYQLKPSNWCLSSRSVQHTQTCTAFKKESGNLRPKTLLPCKWSLQASCWLARNTI